MEILAFFCLYKVKTELQKFIQRSKTYTHPRGGDQPTRLGVSPTAKATVKLPIEVGLGPSNPGLFKVQPRPNFRLAGVCRDGTCPVTNTYVWGLPRRDVPSWGLPRRDVPSYEYLRLGFATTGRAQLRVLLRCINF